MSSDPNRSPSSPAQNSTKEWQDALCILNGFAWPFKVQVNSGVFFPLDDGTTETKRIRLYPRDLKYILEEMKMVLGNGSDELLVPAKSLVPGISRIEKVTTPGNKKGLVKLFDNYYHLVSVENLTRADAVAWVPVPAFPTNSRSELFPCTLYFVGTDSVHPFNTFAFVCPRKTIGDVSLSSEQRKCGKIPGWGMVYRVPLAEIYRWEDINQTQRIISTELDHVFLECHDKINSKYRYELIYKCNLAEQGLKEKKVKYPNLDEMVDANNARIDSTSSPKLKEGGHLTQEKVAEESLRDTNDKTEGTEIHGGLVRPNANRTSCKEDPLRNLPSESKTGENTDDRDQILNGNVSNLKRQFSKHDSSGHSSGKGQKTWGDEPGKIILFGWCIATKGMNINDLQEVNEIKLGDVIVARPYHENQDDILGKVSKICEIPSLRAKQIFVGVKFEDKVNTSPFKVRHVWGEENGECQTRCQGGKKVFIPIEHLLNTSSYSQSILRVLKETKDVKNSTLISEIKVDFNYESSRKDFIVTPIYIDATSQRKIEMGEVGIEGNVNSCYIDSVLFALYAFTCNFDGGLIKPMENTKHYSSGKNVKIEAARNLLKYDIVTQLRSLSKISWVSVFKFRRALSEILNDKAYLGNFMDAETFITSLFADVLQVPEFFELGEDTKDYILQLFPPVADGKTGKGESKSSVQYILEEYFGWAGVKLQMLPKVGFLVKLPVSDGVPHFKYAYPNLKLDLGKILEKKEKGEKFMNLRAVICLKTNHFTCFVRSTARSSDGKPIWLFHDSMAKEVGESILTVCPNLERALEKVSSVFDKRPGKKETLPEEATAWLDVLLKTAYICVYEPVTSHETQL